MGKKKFRLWDFEKKIMVYLNESFCETTGGFWNTKPGDNLEIYRVIIGARVGKCQGTGYFSSDFQEELLNFDLMLGAGVLDRNLTEIFENDIVFHGGLNFQVIFYKGSFVIKTDYMEEIGAEPLFFYEKDLEVVGNIFENPNLLE